MHGPSSRQRRFSGERRVGGAGGEGLVEQIVIGPANNGLEIEIVGEIAWMVDLGLAAEGKTKATLNERIARSVKMVAGAGFIQERTSTQIRKSV